MKNTEKIDKLIEMAVELRSEIKEQSEEKEQNDLTLRLKASCDDLYILIGKEQIAAIINDKFTLRESKFDLYNKWLQSDMKVDISGVMWKGVECFIQIENYLLCIDKYWIYDFEYSMSTENNSDLVKRYANNHTIIHTV